MLLRSSRILVTAFRPFRGRDRNGSATVLQWLRRHWPAGFAWSSLLDVHWENAPSRLEILIQRRNPTVVLGLGEGQSDRITLECRAQNLMTGLDEAGVQREGLKIVENGPAELRTPLRIDSNHFAELPWALTLSTDAGQFLCNRLLWEMLCHRPASSAFIHLPPQGDMADHSYAGLLGPPLLKVLMDLRWPMKSKRVNC